MARQAAPPQSLPGDRGERVISTRLAAFDHIKHWIALHPSIQRFDPPPAAIIQFRIDEVLLAISTDRDRGGAIYNQCWRYEHADWRVEASVEWWLDELAAMCTGSVNTGAVSAWFANQ